MFASLWVIHLKTSTLNPKYLMSNRHCGPHQTCDYILKKKYKLKNYADVNLHTLCPKLTLCIGGGWLTVKGGKP